MAFYLYYNYNRWSIVSLIVHSMTELLLKIYIFINEMFAKHFWNPVDSIETVSIACASELIQFRYRRVSYGAPWQKSNEFR